MMPSKIFKKIDLSSQCESTKIQILSRDILQIYPCTSRESLEFREALKQKSNFSVRNFDKDKITISSEYTDTVSSISALKKTLDLSNATICFPNSIRYTLNELPASGCSEIGINDKLVLNNAGSIGIIAPVSGFIIPILLALVFKKYQGKANEKLVLIAISVLTALFLLTYITFFVQSVAIFLGFPYSLTVFIPSILFLLFASSEYERVQTGRAGKISDVMISLVPQQIYAILALFIGVAFQSGLLSSIIGFAFYCGVSILVQLYLTSNSKKIDSFEGAEVRVLSSVGKSYAMLGFTGKTIFINEAALKKFNAEEVNAILSHELGHIKMKHREKHVTGTLLLFLILGLLDEATYGSFRWIALVSGILFIRFMIRSHEYKADSFALLNSGRSIVSALGKMEANKMWLLDMISTHPNNIKRIRRLSYAQD